MMSTPFVQYESRFRRHRHDSAHPNDFCQVLSLTGMQYDLFLQVHPRHSPTFSFFFSFSFHNISPSSTFGYSEFGLTVVLSPTFVPFLIFSLLLFPFLFPVPFFLMRGPLTQYIFFCNIVLPRLTALAIQTSISSR